MPTKGRPTYWEVALEYLCEGSRAIAKGVAEAYEWLKNLGRGR
jgi:hypothetical protein